MKNFLALDLKPITGFDTGFTANPLADPASRFSSAVSNIIGVITIFAGLSFVIWFVIGAFTWITSADNTQKLDQAKNQMSSAILGLVIVILTVPLVYVIGRVLGLDILKSSDIFKNLVPT